MFDGNFGMDMASWFWCSSILQMHIGDTQSVYPQDTLGDGVSGVSGVAQGSSSIDADLQDDRTSARRSMGPEMGSGATIETLPNPESFVAIVGSDSVREANTDQHSSMSDLSQDSEKQFEHPKRSKKGSHIHYCPFQRCQRPFGRRADLMRHVNARHERTELFLCPAKGCFKKQHRRSFPRLDKLRTHLNAMHQPDSLAECPIEGCSSNSFRLVELFIHLPMAHGERTLLRAMRQWYCPISPCNLPKGQPNLFEHVVEHINANDAAGLEAAAEVLRTKNILLGRSSSLRGRSTLLPRGSVPRVDSLPAMEIQIVCPVCSSRCNDALAFRHHMYGTHLIKPSQQQHFEAWKAYCERFCVSRQFGLEQYEWDLRDLKEGHTVMCPSCGWSTIIGRFRTRVDHHLIMYRDDLSYLKPYRRHIQELYPEFGTEDCWRAVWEDLAQPISKPHGAPTVNSSEALPASDDSFEM